MRGSCAAHNSKASRGRGGECVAKLTGSTAMGDEKRSASTCTMWNCAMDSRVVGKYQQLGGRSQNSCKADHAREWLSA
jgi:hypothetical protein